MTEFPPEVRSEIRARSFGRCEVHLSPACTDRAVQMHHRQRRELGDQRPVNGLDCCTPCHDAIHGSRYAQEAHRRGLLVSRYADSAAVPVLPPAQ